MLGLEGNVADASWRSAVDPQLGGTKIQRSEALFPKPVSV
jgi:hypothetical protein